MAFGPVGRGGRGRYRPMAEINVTPMVDVMLVLLIIFMVAAPLMTSGVTVDLPKASAAPISQDSEPLTITVNAEGKIYLQDTELQVTELAPKLAAISDNKLDRRIFVRGDKGVPYGRIMEVMATITQSGFTKVALLAEQTQGTTPTAPAQTAPAQTAPAQTAPATAATAPAAPASTAAPATAPATGARRPGR